MIKKIISFLIAFLLFLFPLFFIPFPNAVSPDQDKQYLLSLTTLSIFLFYVIQLLIRKKSKFINTPYIVPLGLISFIYLISTVLLTSNKVTAISVPSSTGTFVLLTLLYFLVTQMVFSIFPLLVSSGTLGLIFLLQNSQFLSSLKLPFDNMTMFTFFIPVTVLTLSEIIKYWISLKKKRVDLYLSSRILIVLCLFSALTVCLYNIFKSLPLLVLPFQYGWEIMLDVYKNISNFLFGIGPSNFPYAFTVLKPLSINNSPYWNMTPNQSTSFLLTLATEAGIIALSISIILITKIIYQAKTDSRYYLPSLLSALFFLVFLPANINLLFFFIIILASYAAKTETVEINFFRFKPVPYLFIAILVTTGFALFWQTKLILSDLLFKTAILSANDNNYEKSFLRLDQAFKLNPYSENIYLFSSGLNQKIALDLAKENLASDSAKQKVYSDTLSSSINMIKNVISINPNNVKYWDELLNLYTSLPKDNKDRKQLLLGTVNKIIQLDPVNPYPKLTAGSILFSYSDFQQAESVVNAAINLKPDLNISRYALANIYAQTGNFQNAIPEMQKALDLTSPKDQDYEKLKNQLNQLQQLAVEATKSATPTKK